MEITELSIYLIFCYDYAKLKADFLLRNPITRRMKAATIVIYLKYSLTSEHFFFGS